MSENGLGNPTTHPSGWVDREALVESWTSASLPSEPSAEAIAELDMKYPYRFFNMSVVISTSRDRYIYFALANCLPGKQITAKEAATGVSEDSLYRVAGATGARTGAQGVEKEQQLVCADKDSFCQASLSEFSDLSYTIRMIQPMTAAAGVVESVNLGADEQGEVSSLIPLLVCQIVLHAWLVYLITRLSRMEGSTPLPPRRRQPHHTGGAQKGPDFSNHNWGTMATWHNGNHSNRSPPRARHSSRKHPLCPNKTCVLKRPIFFLVYVSALLHLLAVLLRTCYFGALDADSAVTRTDITDWVVFGGGRSMPHPETILLASDLAFIVSRMAFLLALLLLAKGWKTVRRKISARGRVKLAGFTMAYTMLLLTCFAWEHFVQDTALTKVRYGQGPGTITMVARVCTAAWFDYACITTIRRRGRRKKAGFYRKFCCFYSVYLFALPLFVLASSEITIMWRHTATVIFDHASQFVATAVLSVLWVPSQLRRNFPVLGSDRWVTTSGVAWRSAGRGGDHNSSTADNQVKVKSAQEKEEERQRAVKIAKTLLFKFKRIRDQAEDVEKIVYRLQGRNTQRTVGGGENWRREHSGVRRRVKNRSAIERRSSVPDFVSSDSSSFGGGGGGDVEMTSSVSYGGGGADRASAVAARAIPRSNEYA